MRTLGRRHWLHVIAMLTLSGFLAGCEDSGTKSGGGGGGDVGSNDPKVYAAVGDSTVGGGNGGGDPFPPRLAAMTGSTVLNYGTDSETTGSALGRVGGILANDKPAALLLYVGPVDLIRGYAIDDAVANLQAIIQLAKDNKTVPVVATLLPMSGSHALWADGAKELSRRIRSLASSEGARLADLEARFGSGEGLMLDDGLHPNDAGNQLMAEAYRDAL